MIFAKEALAQAFTIDTNSNIATINGFEGLFGNVLSVAAAFGGIVLFVILMVAGFKYLTSGGNPKSVESAKNTLTYAILGAVLLAAAYLIILLIQQYSGASLTEFEVYKTP